MTENQIGVMFDWENPERILRVSWEIILRLFYLWKKVIIIFRGFRQFREFRGIDLATFSYMVAAANTTNLQDLRHSESPSNLQQFLYLVVKGKINISDRNQKFVLLCYYNFYVLLLFHISFSLLTLISIPFMVWLQLCKYFNCKIFMFYQHKINW